MPTALLLGHLLVAIEAVPTPVHLRVSRVEMRCLKQLGPLLGGAVAELLKTLPNHRALLHRINHEASRSSL